MAHNEGKYPEVENLPRNAKTFEEYAASRENPCKATLLYKELRQEKEGTRKVALPYKVIVFKGRNYIVKRTKKEIAEQQALIETANESSL